MVHSVWTNVGMAICSILLKATVMMGILKMETDALQSAELKIFIGVRMEATSLPRNATI